jgi:anti-anti-sigma regulatory factor/HAMP domain-containing protein
MVPIWYALPIAVKLTLTITAITIASIIGVTFASLEREKRTFSAELEKQAELLLGTLAATASDPLYKLDVDALGDLMKGLTQNRNIVFGQVYDQDGRPIADAYDSTIIFKVASDPWGQEVLASNTTIFDWQADRLIVGRAVRVGNEVVGGISIGLSTEPLGLKIEAVRNEGFIALLVASVFGIGIALLFGRSLARPIDTLTIAATQMAGGDFAQRVAVRSSDEFALLANAFNGMAMKIHDLLISEREHSTMLSDTNARLERTLAEVVQAQQIQDQLNQTIRKLSIPVLSISQRILLVPLIGTMDRDRTEQAMRRILQTIEEQRARITILDVTGVPMISADVATGFAQTARAAQFLGTKLILCGVAPEVAQTIISLGLDLGMFITVSDLHAALERAFALERMSVGATSRA